MTDYLSLKRLIQAQLKENRNSLHITASSIDDALHKASAEFNLPVEKIGYRIVKSSHLSASKDPSVSIVAYPLLQAQNTEAAEDSAAHPSRDQSTPDNASRLLSGQNMPTFPFSIRVTPTNILVRIGKGAHPSAADIQDSLKKRLHTQFDTSIIQEVLSKKENEFHPIAPFTHDPTHDPLPALEVDRNSMVAWLSCSYPGRQGADLTAPQYAFFLKTRDVIYGIQHEVLKYLEEYPNYTQSFKVALGTPPKNGVDAHIQYTVEPHSTSDQTPRQHYKYLRPIVNVIKGQTIAVKTPATKGVDGMNVYGSTVPSVDGKDVSFKCGKGATLIEDGTKVIAEYNGQVSVGKERIEVRNSHVINGDVDIKSGNILMLGNLLIRGNVNDGFKVKASGTIEIMGSVGKAYLDSEDDIIIHQGIAGKGSAYINSDRNISAKFIENATVRAGVNVCALNSIVNSEVWAGSSVICSNANSSIVGGSVCAKNLISAKLIGTENGTAATLQVGRDPFRQMYLTDYQHQREKLNQELNKYLLMERKKPQAGNKPPSAIEQEINANKESVTWELSKIDEEINILTQEIQSTQTQGTISVGRILYPGNTLVINDIDHVVKNEIRHRSLVVKKGKITLIPYTEDVSTTN